MIICPRGAVLAEAGGGECTVGANLDIEALIEYRRSFPVLSDLSDG